MWQKRFGHHSFVLLCLNGFDIIWLLFSWICPWFLIISVGQTLRPLQNPKVVFRGTHTHTRANILGSDIGNLWGFDPGFWFCRARNLVQHGTARKRGLKKMGLEAWICRECRVWSDPCLWFCRGPPPHFLTLYLQNASPQPDPPNWREDDIYIYRFIYFWLYDYICYIHIYFIQT